MWLGRYSFFIDASPDKVWNHLASIEMLNSWLAGTMGRGRFGGTGQIIEGQEFDYSHTVEGKTFSFGGLVQRVDPQRRLVLLAGHKGRQPRTFKWDVALKDARGGTRVQLSMSMRLMSLRGHPWLDILLEPCLLMMPPLFGAYGLLVSYVWPMTYLSPIYELKELIEREGEDKEEAILQNDPDEVRRFIAD